MTEGIPEGWELVRIGKPVPKVDWVVNHDGTPTLCSVLVDAENWPVIRKIEQAPKYRPFANAAEFEPHRNRWIKQSYIDDSCEVGCFRVHRYDDKGVYNVGEHLTYQEMFDDGKCFDDGTPFGVRIDGE